ncbi:MAG: hypothetical protein DHS20C18_44610 [Saprospiraceae bacterium]|nr:MAG: hypothetical protein DHS20C18_44610 [Saprospiraceae bacterium]
MRYWKFTSLCVLFLVFLAAWINPVPIVYERSLPPDGIFTSNNFTTNELVTDIFAQGICDNITNIQSIGNQGGIGYFENADNIMGLARGIILSTGPINNALGPNDATDKSGNFEDASGDIDLNDMSTGAVYDAVGIEFDFIPLDSFVTFRYVFASEEYCEFVGSIYNDVFGFFIRGPGISGNFSGGAKNVALIPGSDDFVAINTVNHNSNNQYYTGNERQEDAEECNIPFSNSSNLELIEYDGFTSLLTASLKLTPCETYHIRFVVSDVGDNFYDSAVFLEAGSFNIGTEVAITPYGPVGEENNTMTEGCSDGYFTFSRSTAITLINPLTVNFKVTGQSTATPGLDFSSFSNSITIPAGAESIDLPIQALNDQLTEPAEQLILELDIPCACYTDTARLFLIDPDPFLLDLPDVLICENAMSELNAEVSGGVPPYTYEWDNMATDSTIPIPPDGPSLYVLTVTDACGHVITDSSSVNLVVPPEGTLSGFAEICEGDTAFFPIVLSGSPPWQIQYSIDGNLQNTIGGITANPFLLPAYLEGAYQLETVSDQACEGESHGTAQIDLMRIEVEVSSEEVTCFGGQDGSISVSLSGGHPPYQIAWSHTSSSDTSTEGLEAGIYMLSITDTRNCEKVVEIDLPSPPPLEQIEVDCEQLTSGSLVLQASGGTAPYIYSIDGEQFEDNGLFASLNPGEQYYLWIQDAHGCELEQDFLMPIPYDQMVELPEQLEIQLGFTQTIMPTLNIPENMVGNIRWTPSTNLSCSDCLEPEIIALEEGIYTIRIIDIFGCSEEASVELVIDPNVNVFMPTAFSPNGDGVNEYFTVFANEAQVTEVLSFQIFDRWGGQAFVKSAFLPNVPNQGWNGMARGKPAPTGLYVYMARLLLSTGDEVLIKGEIVLLR